MVKTRYGLAFTGFVCVFLLIVTGFIGRSDYRRTFSDSFPSSKPSQEEIDSSPGTDDANKSNEASVPAPVPLEALREPSIFESYGLASAKCNTEFGPLFKEIERSAAHRKSIGNVTPTDLDLGTMGDGVVRAMIWRQKLFVLDTHLDGEYMIPRALSILHQIDRAIVSSPDPIPEIEFSFSVGDRPDHRQAPQALWALTRMAVDEEIWLMPDFGYWSWPLELVGAYEQIRVEMVQNQLPWRERIPKVLWRGALKTNEIRKTMYRLTRNKDWADIKEVKWKNRTDVSASSATSSISMADHCNYQYLLHTEGRSYSGRGKYLLNCGSTVIMHKSEWIEPHQDVYVKAGASQNVVEVERDFSDLEEKMQELLSKPKLAQTIAENNQKTFRDRYLTPAAQVCYWRKLFRRWADVSFKPEPFEVVNGKARLRGIPFETFVIRTMSKSNPNCSVWRKVTLQC